MSRLTFTEGNHAYWLAGDNGKKQRVPSVSSLKKTLHTFDNDTWKAQQIADAITDDWDRINQLPPTSRPAAMKEAGMRRLAEAREFGTAVHAYAEQLWNGQPVEVPDDYRAHVAGIAEWWTTNRIKLWAAEVLCWAPADPGLEMSPMAGRVDLIIEHPELGRGIVDMKTWRAGSSGAPRGEEWAFQLAAYSQMHHAVINDQDDPFPSIAWVGALHIGPPGTTLWVLPQPQWRIANDQVDAARVLKNLPKPRMQEHAA